MKKKVDNLNPANMLTMLRIALVPLYVWLFSMQRWDTVFIALIVFIIAALTDMYDGKIARRRAEITRLGKFMDPLADKLLVISALAQFWIVGLVNFWLVSVIIIRDVWVTIIRIDAMNKGTELKTSRNAKLKTTIQLTVVITIIVFTGSRFLALHLGYNGQLVDISFHKIFFNLLLSVAVIFTLYSWFKYMIRGRIA